MLEDDVWCRVALAANTGLEAVPHTCPWADLGPWDIVVVDGGDDRDDYYADLRSRAIVFFEGGRRGQRAVLEATWRGRRAFCRAHWKPADRSKGFWIYQLEPTSGERLWFAAVRARETIHDAVARLVGRPIGKRRHSAPERSETYAASTH